MINPPVFLGAVEVGRLGLRGGGFLLIETLCSPKFSAEPCVSCFVRCKLFCDYFVSAFLFRFSDVRYICRQSQAMGV